jgi:hypothetical protein
MRGLDPRIHEAAQRRKPYVVGASSWIAGSSPRLSGLIFLDEAHGVDSSVF